MKMLTKHLDLFASLNREGVEYLLVGGVVAIAYGVPRTTQDIDLLINPTVQNALKLLKTLKKLGFGTAELITPTELVKTEVTLFKDYFRIDVLTKLKKFEFKDVYPRRNMVRVGQSLYIPIISLDDFLVEKKSISRKKDLQDIELLNKFSKERKRRRKKN